MMCMYMYVCRYVNTFEVCTCMYSVCICHLYDCTSMLVVHDEPHPSRWVQCHTMDIVHIVVVILAAFFDVACPS